MQLEALMQGVPYQILSGVSQDVKGIAYDSNNVRDGFLFVCISGFKTDGHQYVAQAIENGASVILTERTVEVRQGITLLLTDHCREALPILAKNYYHNPSQNLNVIGVTGTNGKTTTTHLIMAILEAAGKKVGIMGTLYARFEDLAWQAEHTTPESLDIQKFMYCAREKSGEYIVMEVSSHALDLDRVRGIQYNSAIFTNLTQDHLDYHKSMENYKQSKLKLFQQMVPGERHFTVVNADDDSADDFRTAGLVPCYTYGILKEAEVRARILSTSLKGSSFTFQFQGEEYKINMKLIGRFSIYNALAAITYSLAEGIEPETIKKVLETVEGVPGRFEQVDCGQDFSVIVDYAHTPDGLENILKTGGEIVENRIITVFGCGGDRDRGKRPIMGKIAGQYSDFCIVTSDNPRSEDPEAIINEIIPGILTNEKVHYAKIIDRCDAIHHALTMAKKGDLVMIAGKGHETYQLIKDQVLDFDDRQVAREFLKGIKKK